MIICRMLIALLALALSSLMPLQGQPTWKVFGSLANARSNYQALVIGNGEVLVMGGYNGTADGGTPTAKCELIDINQRTITPAASLNIPRALFVALLTPDSNIVAIGGDMIQNINTGALTPTVELYNRSAKRWDVIGSLITPRYQHAAAFISDHEILVVGGRHADLSTMASAEIFDITTGTSRSIADFPFPINSAVMEQSSTGDIIVFGGRSGGTNSYRERNVYRYSSTTNSWLNTGTVADPIQSPQILKLWDKRIAISGGSRNEAPHDFRTDVEIEQNNQWTTIAHMQIPRAWGAMAQWNNDSIMTIGGYDNADNTLRSTDWINLVTGQSTLGPQMNVAHHRATAVTVPTTIINNRPVAAAILVISGQQSFTSATPIVEILEQFPCIATVSAGIDRTICKGDSVQLEASWGKTFEWSPHSGLGCTDCRTPMASPDSTTTYTLIARDASGCQGTTTVTVHVHDRLKVVSADPNGPFTIDAGDGASTHCIDITLSNPTSEPMLLDAVTMQRNIEFSVPPGQLPLVIPSGEERPLQVCYRSTSPMLQRDTLHIALDCPMLLSLQAIGADQLESEIPCAGMLRFKPADSADGMLRIIPAYPNPASKQVMIPLELLSVHEHLSNAHCLLYDATGKVVAEGTYHQDSEIAGTVIYESGTFILDVQHLNAGTYFAVITSQTYSTGCPIILIPE